jgi:peptidoglycan-N-acetylglucosamine deacetylase
VSRGYGQHNYENREFVLTFHDGPLPATTSLLLDTLAKHEIKAVFFPVGKLLATSQGATIARRAQAEGHILGNHSFSHLNLRGLTKGKVREELRRTHDLIC